MWKNWLQAIKMNGSLPSPQPCRAMPQISILARKEPLIFPAIGFCVRCGEQTNDKKRSRCCCCWSQRPRQITCCPSWGHIGATANKKREATCADFVRLMGGDNVLAAVSSMRCNISWHEMGHVISRLATLHRKVAYWIVILHNGSVCHVCVCVLEVRLICRFISILISATQCATSLFDEKPMGGIEHTQIYISMIEYRNVC